MRQVVRSLAAVCVLAALSLPALAEPLTYAQLKSMVENMGYAPSELKSETPLFEVKISTDKFDVPIGFELSKSGRYIWARASLGTSKLTGEEALEVLKSASDIQPTMFWISDAGNLMIGMAIDNRDVTPAHLRFVLEKIAGDVNSTAKIWDK